MKTQLSILSSILAAGLVSCVAQPQHSQTAHLSRYPSEPIPTWSQTSTALRAIPVTDQPKPSTALASKPSSILEVQPALLRGEPAPARLVADSVKPLPLPVPDTSRTPKPASATSRQTSEKASPQVPAVVTKPILSGDPALDQVIIETRRLLDAVVSK